MHHMRYNSREGQMLSKVHEKGLRSLIRVSELSSTNGEDEAALSQRLRSAVAGTIFVHPECRRVYTDTEIGSFENSRFRTE